jgi:hypothetical protein
MKLMIFLTIIFLATGVLFSQNDTIEVGFESKKPSYISITDVLVAPGHYFSEPESDYYAGFKYRAIITMSEIYSRLYIEKITLDIEGSTMKILWSKEIDVKTILGFYSLSQETTAIEDFCWQNFNTFRFSIAGMKLGGRLDTDEKDRISLYIIVEDCVQ